MEFQQLTSQKSATLSAIILLITQKNIYKSISVNKYHYLEQIGINDRSTNFCQAAETETVESIMHLNKEGGISHVSRNFIIICENLVSYYLKELLNFCIDSLVFQMFLKLLKIHRFIKKVHLTIYQNIDRFLYLITSAKFSKIFYLIVFKVFVTHPTFSQKNQFDFRKHRNTELAALSLLYKVLPALEDNKYAMCVFIDC